VEEDVDGWVGRGEGGEVAKSWWKEWVSERIRRLTCFVLGASGTIIGGI
jgi:hypothetical protein